MADSFVDYEEQANYKIGSIYKRSKIFKRWTKRSIVLNFIKATLSLRKGKSSKEKVMNLENCEVVWIENSKSKVHYFLVKAIKNLSQEKYKRMNLGDTDEVNARVWKEEIEKIINKKYEVSLPIQIKEKPKKVQFSSQSLLPKQPERSIKNGGEIGYEMLLSPNYNGRQVLSVNKEDDYDVMLKQFESCCQYGDNDASEYDEWKPHEKGVIIPIFNAAYSFEQMPNIIQENPGIDKFCENAPESIRDEVKIILDSFYLKQEHFIEQYLANLKCKEVEKNIYFKEDSTYLILKVDNMNPLEIFEEIQTPSTSEHWSEIMDSYTIQPADGKNNEIRNLSLIQYKFKFDKGDGKFEEKEIICYRYSIQFYGAYFIWEFQNLSNRIDESIIDNLPNKVRNTIIIFNDPTLKNTSYICCKSGFQFLNEPKSLQFNNTRRFLKAFEGVNKCIESINNDNNIIVEWNEDVEEEIDEIDSHVFISVRIDRPITIGNAEMDFSDEEITAILLKLVNKQYITDCIKAKHERRIVSGVYHVVKSSKESWQNSYKRDEKKGGLLFINEKLLKEQRSVLMSIVKRIGSNFLNGKSIMNISMPVQVFDSKSMIQRLAKGFGHAPIFLEKAGFLKSVTEQIKLSAAFLLSTFIMGINQEKPFNPLIGETIQARLNGCPIYFEQTSHHPAACNYLMYGRGYDLYGCHIPMVNMGPNSLGGSLAGNPTIYFKNTNSKVMCLWSNFMIYNLIFGQRTLNATGRAFVFEAKSCLVLELIFNPNNATGLSSIFSKKYAIDEISGAIYKVKPEVIEKLVLAHKSFNRKSDLALDPQKDVLKFISKAEGIWNNHLEFDGVKYWDDKRDFPYICEYEINPLPSDSLYREDLLYFLKNDKKKAQDKKEEIEESQRYDQKLRDIYKQKRNK